MKEIGILYSTEMVRAKLEDRKSMTRRTRGLEEINKEPDRWEFVRFYDGYAKFCEKNNWTNEVYVKCPYGQPGNLHYVRETHYRFGVWIDDKGEFTPKGRQKKKFIPTTSEILFSESEPIGVVGKQPNELSLPRWYKRSSLFLEKDCARIWDEVVSVRAERLQDISPNDACNEGVEYWNIDYDALEGGELQADFKNYTWRDDENYEDYHFPTFANSVDSFRSLWQSINGKESWNHNPWVWVIGTKNISKTGKPS